MKTKICLLLTAALILSINCSAANIITAANVRANLPNNINSPTVNENSAEPKAQTKLAPDALVKSLYNAPESPFFQAENRALVDKYFDKNLADLIWEEAKQPRDGVGALEADPLHDAQDSDIKKFVVGKPKITGDLAQVVVSFQNFKKPIKINYTLIKQNGDWKISDIIYGADRTLVSIYKEYAKTMAEMPNQPQGAFAGQMGEFEGKYKIGDTTCTVKALKMAFEVKWVKGKGVEMFFSQGEANDKFIFASDPKTGKANVFSFDDENYNSGIFYRADGKELPISRVK